MMMMERSSSSCFSRAASLGRTLSNGGKPLQGVGNSGNGTPVVSAVTVTYVLGVFACVLLFMSTFHERQPQPQAAGTALGKRSWRDLQSISRSKQWEALVLQQEAEIATLKAQLDKLTSGNSIKEANLQAQEAMIRVLQDKAQSEREARAKAQFALSEKVEGLDGCLRQRKALEAEVTQCHSDLAPFLAAAGSHSAGSFGLQHLGSSRR